MIRSLRILFVLCAAVSSAPSAVAQSERLVESKSFVAQLFESVSIATNAPPLDPADTASADVVRAHLDTLTIAIDAALNAYAATLRQLQRLRTKDAFEAAAKLGQHVFVQEELGGLARGLAAAETALAAQRYDVAAAEVNATRAQLRAAAISLEDFRRVESVAAMLDTALTGRIALSTMYDELAAYRSNRDRLLKGSREGPCRFSSIAGNEQAGRSTARIDLGKTTSTREYYPEGSRRNGEQGMIGLVVRLDRRGCPVSAQVRASSGFKRLDQAALKWALDASYVPALDNGDAIETSLPLRVRFNLLD
jgi:TonB family protein